VEDEAGEDGEDGKRDGGDTSLEADDDGKTGNKFEDASEIGKRGCSGEPRAGDHAGRAGRIDQLGIAGDDEHGREKNAAGEKQKVVRGGVVHGRSPKLVVGIERTEFLKTYLPCFIETLKMNNRRQIVIY